MNLNGQKILLGITGGIAAYKCAELVRLLVKAGADVRVVMTEAARQFVTPMTLQTLSGNPVRQELFELSEENEIGHIELARWADLILVAPATANFISGLAQGVASDLLGTICVAADVKIAVAPAMNRAMWANQATRENIALLSRRGVKIWGPVEGEQACGETGEGRMLEPAELLQRVTNSLIDPVLAGKQVLMTVGPTHEPIDPVRFIGNRSSGKMGFAIADSLSRAGANVTMACGPVELQTPRNVHRIDVETAWEMADAVKNELVNCDIFIATAAVADYRVTNVAKNKIKKNDKLLTLQLEPNEDILAWVAKQDNAPFTLGFAAETENLVEYAAEKKRRKGLNMIAANLVGRPDGGFGDDNNALSVISDDGMNDIPMQAKSDLANALVKLLSQNYKKWYSRKIDGN